MSNITREMHENLQRVAERHVGRLEDPIKREALGSFDRKALFSECHEILSTKILSEVARQLTSLGLDVRIQDAVEVMALTPGNCVVEIRREGDTYRGLNRSANGNTKYWEGEVCSFDDLKKIANAGR